MPQLSFSATVSVFHTFNILLSPLMVCYKNYAIGRVVRTWRKDQSCCLI